MSESNIEELKEIAKKPNPKLCMEIGNECLLEKIGPCVGICYRCRLKYLAKKTKEAT
jgi:hypothetical protein